MIYKHVRDDCNELKKLLELFLEVLSSGRDVAWGARLP